MQELKYQLSEMSHEIIQKFYVATGNGDIEKALNQAMDEDVVEGVEVVRRIAVGRNEKCPCGSGKKFKKCCIYKAKRVDAL